MVNHDATTHRCHGAKVSRQQGRHIGSRYYGSCQLRSGDHHMALRLLAYTLRSNSWTIYSEASVIKRSIRRFAVRPSHSFAAAVANGRRTSLSVNCGLQVKTASLVTFSVQWLSVYILVRRLTCGSLIRAQYVRSMGGQTKRAGTTVLDYPPVRQLKLTAARLLVLVTQCRDNCLPNKQRTCLPGCYCLDPTNSSRQQRFRVHVKESKKVCC